MVMINKNTLIFLLLIILCIDFSTQADESLAGKETEAWPWFWRTWPPISWWRWFPWWRQPLPPPPPPPPLPDSPAPKPTPHPHFPPPRRHGPPPPPHTPPAVPPPPPHTPPAVPPPPPHTRAPGVPPPVPVRDPSDCSSALIYVEGCVRELITSFFEEKARVGDKCCRAISGISDDCFKKAFTQFESPGFIGKIRGFCANQQP